MDAGGGLGDDPALAALRDVLAALSATTPRLVFQKTLTKTDVDRCQRRLHMPCRRTGNNGVDDDDDGNALPAFLTADERDVCDDACRGEALQVPAYDRHGRRFDMRLRMLLLRSSSSYRLFGPEWYRFVRNNQLEEAMAAAKEMGRKLEVEVWAFRSVELMPLGAGARRGDRPPPERGSRDGDTNKELIKFANS